MTCGRLCRIVVLCAVVPLKIVEAQPVAPPGLSDCYIVQVTPGADPGQVGRGIVQRTNGKLGHVYTNAVRGFSFRLPPGWAKRVIETQPGVLLVEPDVPVYAVAQTLPTGVDRIEGDNSGATSPVDVDIAIIDTGVDVDHPDLNVVGGRHFYSLWGMLSFEDDQYDDDNGHGTHCAGIAAAKDNDFGVVGVAPGARIYAVKALDSTGSGYLSDIIAGVDWVTARADTIEVASMSLSAIANSSIFRTAIQNSVAAGVVHFVAAGNDARDVYGLDGVFGTSDDIIPAAYPEAATISAMADSDGQPGGTGSSTAYGHDDSFAYFSNDSHSVAGGNPVTSPGMAIDLMLPGVDILSCYMNGGYAVGSGTSMASPHAAGLAALYIAVNGRATSASGVYAIRQALIDGGIAQTDPERGLYLLNDFDENYENIGWADSSQVEPPTLSSVQINPESATIEQGEMQQYTATALYSDNSETDVTDQAEWYSTNSSVATVDLFGLATGVAEGIATITATFDGVTSNGATLTVTAAAPITLQSILVEPENTEITVDGNQQYVATGTYSDDSTADITNTAIWVSSVLAVATVNDSGLASGLAVGTTDITAALDGVTSNAATLTVTAVPLPTLQSILVEPETAEITVDGNQQYVATGTYSDGSTADITNTAIWTSSVPEVATVDTSGLAMGITEGATTIKAELDSVISNSATLAVTQAPSRSASVSVDVMPLFSYKRWWVATAMVTVTENGTSVAGATVEGTWSGLYNKSASNTTDVFGFISFETSWLRKAGTVTFTVTKVVAPDGQEYVLDPAEPSDFTDGP